MTGTKKLQLKIFRIYSSTGSVNWWWMSWVVWELKLLQRANIYFIIGAETQII